MMMSVEVPALNSRVELTAKEATALTAFHQFGEFTLHDHWWISQASNVRIAGLCVASLMRCDLVEIKTLPVAHGRRQKIASLSRQGVRFVDALMLMRAAKEQQHA